MSSGDSVNLLEWLTRRATVRTQDDEIGDVVPVRIVEVTDALAGRQNMLNTSGQVTEASAATIATAAATTNSILGYLNQGQQFNPLAFDASGTAISTVTCPDWFPIIPITITADGAGLPPATEIIALVAALRLDVMLWWTVDTVSAAGQYEHNFRTDPLGAVGGVVAVVPNWTNIIIPCAARETQPGNTYGHRMMTGVVASAFGIADGANGDWPNGAQVTFFGFYRAVA